MASHDGISPVGVGGPRIKRCKHELMEGTCAECLGHHAEVPNFFEGSLFANMGDRHYTSGSGRFTEEEFDCGN